MSVAWADFACPWLREKQFMNVLVIHVFTQFPRNLWAQTAWRLCWRWSSSSSDERCSATHEIRECAKEFWFYYDHSIFRRISDLCLTSRERQVEKKVLTLWLWWNTLIPSASYVLGLRTSLEKEWRTISTMSSDDSYLSTESSFTQTLFAKLELKIVREAKIESVTWWILIVEQKRSKLTLKIHQNEKEYKITKNVFNSNLFIHYYECNEFLLLLLFCSVSSHIYLSLQ